MIETFTLSGKEYPVIHQDPAAVDKPKSDTIYLYPAIVYERRCFKAQLLISVLSDHRFAGEVFNEISNTSGNDEDKMLNVLQELQFWVEEW